MVELSRFRVVFGGSGIQLQEALNKADPTDDYVVRGISSAPWFEKGGPDNTLEQTADSVYVLLERRWKP